MQPGMDPSSAPITTCPVLVLRSPLKNRPLDSMLSDSIIIIITMTRPLISMEFRRASVTMCSMQLLVNKILSLCSSDFVDYSIQPVMKRFTIGRRGELVVSVTMVSISPSGIFDVSMSTVNVVQPLGSVAGILPCAHWGASMSTL